MSSLTKALIGLYWAALTTGSVLLIWLLVVIATALVIGREAAERLPQPDLWPWLPVSVVTMYVAKLGAGWSHRRDIQE